MDYVYEDERIPLQIRRLLIFDEICKLAKKQPDEIIHLLFYAQKNGSLELSIITKSV